MSLGWAIFIIFHICIMIVAIATGNVILVKFLLVFYLLIFILEMATLIIKNIAIKLFKLPEKQVTDYLAPKYSRFAGIWVIIIGLGFAIKTLYLTIFPNQNELLSFEIQITNYLVAIFCIAIGVAFLVVKTSKQEK